MNRLFIFFIIAALIAMSACQEKAPGNPPAQDGQSAQDEQAAPDGQAVPDEQSVPYKQSTPNGQSPTDAQSPADAQTPPNEAPARNEADEVIEIKEKMFVAQTNDIYFNVEDYLGKTIKYEGIFKIYEVPETDLKYYSVIRYGPGCCGVDANAGFEVAWKDEQKQNDYPKDDDWVEVTGALEKYEEDEIEYLRLALSSIEKLKKRGAENVKQ